MQFLPKDLIKNIYLLTWLDQLQPGDGGDSAEGGECAGVCVPLVCSIRAQLAC